MSFRDRLIRLRDENKLSQQDMAELLDVSRQTISRWESGKSVPSANQVSNICRVFRLNANEFVDGDGQNADARQPRTVEPTDRRRLSIALIVTVAVFLLLALAGLVLTVVYAVKDAVYDASTTVWIMAIPKNTPMIILSVFLAVFILLLSLLFVYLLRGRKK